MLTTSSWKCSKCGDIICEVGLPDETNMCCPRCTGKPSSSQGFLKITKDYLDKIKLRLDKNISK